MNFRLDLSPAFVALTGQPAALLRRAGSLAAKRAAEDYVTAIHDWIHAGHAFKPRTGALEQGLGWQVQGDGALVYSQAAYGPYVEFDTRPHVIGPKAGRQALRWFAGGGIRFARGVNHPGTKARPFFYADRAARQEILRATARQAIAEVLGAGYA